MFLFDTVSDALQRSASVADQLFSSLFYRRPYSARCRQPSLRAQEVRRSGCPRSLPEVVPLNRRFTICFGGRSLVVAGNFHEKETRGRPRGRRRGEKGPHRKEKGTKREARWGTNGSGFLLLLQLGVCYFFCLPGEAKKNTRRKKQNTLFIRQPQFAASKQQQQQQHQVQWHSRERRVHCVLDSSPLLLSQRGFFFLLVHYFVDLEFGEQKKTRQKRRKRNSGRPVSGGSVAAILFVSFRYIFFSSTKKALKTYSKVIL